MSEDEIRAAIARGQAEAVRMLDEWASKWDRSWRMRFGGGSWLCELDFDVRQPLRAYRGDSPEAARANAAEAIRGEL